MRNAVRKSVGVALIGLLDQYFTAFDEIVTRHGLEKLKTIGDAYMAVAGVPAANRGHPFDACLAALKPGGVAIFETPNPENVLVGSCDFWYDPTHRAPLPPDMMRWVALSRGFARAEIMRLHPVGPEGQLRDGNEAVRTMLNERFNGPRDYAVVAYAPRARRK